MKMRIEKGKPLNLNDQLNAIAMGLMQAPISPQYFPTPRANSGTGKCVHGEGGLDLQTAVQIWPTPRASDAEHGGPNQRDSQGNYALPGAVAHWPTPRAGNPGSRPNKKGGKILAEEVKKSVFPTPTVCGNYNRKGISSKSGDGLETAVRLWATPTANDAKNSLTESQAGRGTLTAHLVETGDAVGGQLNADWVEILMGYPQGWTDTEKETLVFADLPLAWLDGSWEADIPRIITGQKNRVKRLKGLGNSVVPLIPMMIWLLIKEFILSHEVRT